MQVGTQPGSAQVGLEEAHPAVRARPARTPGGPCGADDRVDRPAEPRPDAFLHDGDECLVQAADRVPAEVVGAAAVERGHQHQPADPEAAQSRRSSRVASSSSRLAENECATIVSAVPSTPAAAVAQPAGQVHGMAPVDGTAGPPRQLRGPALHPWWTAGDNPSHSPAPLARPCSSSTRRCGCCSARWSRSRTGSGLMTAPPAARRRRWRRRRRHRTPRSRVRSRRPSRRRSGGGALQHAVRAGGDTQPGVEVVPGSRGGDARGVRISFGAEQAVGCRHAEQLQAAGMPPARTAMPKRARAVLPRAAAAAVRSMTIATAPSMASLPLSSLRTVSLPGSTPTTSIRSDRPAASRFRPAHGVDPGGGAVADGQVGAAQAEADRDGGGDDVA